MTDGNIKELGFIEKGTGKHQSNTVISSLGSCYTLCSSLYKSGVLVIDERNNKTR